MPKPVYLPLTSREKRSVAALLVSTFAATVGSTATVTALGILIYDLTHREFDLGLVGLLEFAPAFILVLLTGSIADRFDRRRVAAIALGGEALVLLAMCSYTTSPSKEVAPIFGLVLLFGAARAFVAPSERSLRADIVPAARVPWVSARYSAVWQGATVVGPVMAGYSYTHNPAAPFALASGLMAIGALAVCTVAKPLAHVSVVEDETQFDATELVDEDSTPSNDGGRLHEALEGFRFVRHSPMLLGAISLDLFAVLFGGAIALLPAIAEDQLHVGAAGLGWLRAASGIGAGLMALILVVRPIKQNVGRLLFVAVTVFGCGTIALGLANNIVVAFICVLILSAADAISVFIRSTLVPLVTPRDKRGRVLAIENVFIGASNELGAFESGVAGQALGASGAVVLGGFGTLAVAGIWATKFPALRKLDRFPGSPTTT